VELRQLRFFVTLAEELNFRRAAGRVYIAQPAFSEQIRRLESELGARLFDRTSHYVRLTEAGRLFLDEIRPALAQVEHAAAVAALAGRGVLGTLRVGLAAAAINELTPGILREFATRCPDVGVVLREFGFFDPAAGLSEREVDIAFVRPPLPRQHDLEVIPLRSEPRVAVMAADHPLAGSESLSLEDMAGEPLVTGPRPTSLRERLPLDPIADTVETWLSLIAAGRGIGLAPASSERFHSRPELAFVPLTGLVESTLAIAHRLDASAPSLRDFVDVALLVARRSAREVRRARGDRRLVSR
jgi:DNA-binding transcriptional LysR family regulator